MSSICASREIDTQRIGFAREQAEVSHLIGDLQAKVARQAQDLAFYRGVGAAGRARRIARGVDSAAAHRRDLGSPRIFACI